MAERDLSHDAIEQLGHPRHGQEAQIQDVARLWGLVGRPSPNGVWRYLSRLMGRTDLRVPTEATVTRIINGFSGTYPNVNWVFTAVNMDYHSLDRSEYVFVGERSGPKSVDVNLGTCSVFPRLAELMLSLSILDHELAAAAYVTRDEEVALVGASNQIESEQAKPVRSHYIVRMRRGLPVRRDKVVAVVRALNEMRQLNLSIEQETCP